MLKNLTRLLEIETQQPLLTNVALREIVRAVPSPPYKAFHGFCLFFKDLFIRSLIALKAMITEGETESSSFHWCFSPVLGQELQPGLPMSAEDQELEATFASFSGT